MIDGIGEFASDNVTISKELELFPFQDTIFPSLWYNVYIVNEGGGRRKRERKFICISKNSTNI